MADTGYIASETGPPAAALGKDMNISQPIYIDEDDANSSTNDTELFDRNSTSSSQKDKLQLDTNGKWQRFGSSESAISTGITSVCSSVAADETSVDNIALPTPSRKRSLDGSLKYTSPKLAQATQATATSPAMTQKPCTMDDQQPPLKIAKRRGRPPKIRPSVAEGAAQTPPTTSRIPKTAKASKAEVKVRPRSSIPSRLPADEFASQCIEAAVDARLDPYSLHLGEHKLLGDWLTSKEVTVYLNIRNAIIRLWAQNPLCFISADEAAGCAKETRFFGLAEVAYKWLTRNGYINFGCLEVPQDPTIPKRFSKDTRQRTVVVVGAGVSGLTTARQLESLFRQEAAKWVSIGERPPRVIILEARKRIGGRVYSKPLRSQVTGSLPDGLRNTAEMGAMIVTGFEHGNPLDTIIRGQLGLRYHLMKDALTIYDCDGRPIDDEIDKLNTELYTDISDRAGEYRAEPSRQETLHGDEDLINRCRDPVPDGFSAFQLEPLPAAHIKAHKPAFRRGRRRNAPPGTEKLTGRSEVVEEGSGIHSASRAAKNMGWKVRDGVARNQSISLHRMATSSRYPTLGSVMDEAINQYQDLIKLTDLDMRLLNWHHANLEYANAAPVSQLSLSGHDQDTGNEFEGAHSEIIGGYTQLPRGLMNFPTKLDVYFDRVVESIHYDDGKTSNGPITTKIVCTDGEVIEANEVVITAPLGVLKSETIDFDPPLPSWKAGAIDRMGFGLLNKVILLYDAPFWDDERDMFGLLNEAEQKGSLEPSDYSRKRGRFYLIWNASKISGRPMLIALMAGNAAHDAEWTDTTTLMNEVTERLRGVFKSKVVPQPIEAIVTRWRRDPFTRGTYSYVGPETKAGDYDLMAKPVGNLHFAGEATCGTHPATVHGAFLSGLRVAADVIERMTGVIQLPTPLVEASTLKQEAAVNYTLPALPASAAPFQPLLAESGDAAAWGGVMMPHTTTQVDVSPTRPTIKQEDDEIQLASILVATPQPATGANASTKPTGPPAKSVCASDPSFWVSAAYQSSDLDYEAGIISTILGQIGERPIKPTRPGVNPFLLFTKDKWDECKAFCSSENSSSGRDAIRQMLGKWWKAADESTKQPYLIQSQTAQELADALRRDWETSVQQWEKDASRIRQEYMNEHPPAKSIARGSDGNGVSKRKTNVSNCVVLDHL